MPAKRALKLESHTMGKVPATPLFRSKKNLKSYSPTTGTCLISPFSSPKSSNVQEHGNGLSNGNREKPNNLLIRSSRRGHPQMEEYDKLLALQSEVEDSLDRFMQMRQNLTNLQTLEGTRELENIIGGSDNSGNLKGEVRKTRKLQQAGKRKLLKRSNVRHPAQVHSPLWRRVVSGGNAAEAPLTDGVRFQRKEEVESPNISNPSTTLSSLNPSLTKECMGRISS
ncbi:centromere protein R isoform X2 [Rhineura floridana]|uniref:centromere protein R isoform X2 n=1 Tax=Rhineura floridana TaxID=261503 RepID=UPI002AC88065|nr:centromere protein R isoform X2 [Rhineura floridana]